MSGGSTRAQTSVARGQRVRNRHPEGGSIALGTSPRSTMRSRAALALGSGRGIAESSATV